MEMTYDQYIQNPMGIANAVISNRNMYRELYMNKLDKILVRELGHIDYTLYKDKKKYYVYIKIPSEVVEKFYYDVVVEFTEPKDKSLMDSTLKNYTVKFYSNDPSFVFTFAHAFIKNDMFIKELKDVMSKEAIKKVAQEKNPSNQVGYVKSLYFAYLILKKENIFDKKKFILAKDIDWKKLQQKITPADLKIAQRQEGAREIAIKNKKAKAELNRLLKKPTEPDIPYATKSANKISNVKTTKTTNKLNTVKKSKKI